MTFALTSVEAYAVQADEPLVKKFIQRLRLVGTAANTNVAYDFGTYAGTYWTAVGSTAPGINALACVKSIQLSAASFLRIGGTALAAKGQFPASAPLVTALTSAAYGGGSATPTLTVTGLLTTDTILGATQIAKNSNSLPLIGAAATCAVNDQYAVVYSADPGTTGTVRVMISRTSTAVPTGNYQIAMDGTNGLIPNLLFLSGNAPTAYDFLLEWELAPGADPVIYSSI